MWVAFWSLAALACDEVRQAASDAKASVLELEFDAARASLERANAGLGCGDAASPTDLGLLWLVQGTLASFDGDEANATAPYAAAARVAPDLWVLDFGPGPQAQYLAAKAEPRGVGTIQVVDVPDGWWLGIDGVEAQSPLGVTEGLHALQVGPRRDAIAFGRVVAVGDGERVVVETGLAAPPPVPVPQDAVVVEPRPRGRDGLSAVVAVGAGVAIGPSLERDTFDGERVTEPAVKAVVPVEVGARLDLGMGWVRLAGGAGPLLGGSLLYVSDDGIAKASVGVQAHVSGGLRAGSVRAGGLLGAELPGRQTVRGVAGIAWVDGVEMELRLGANRVGGRGVEPAGALLFAVTPRVASIRGTEP